MKVFWSKQAGITLTSTTSYIKNAFGNEAKINYIREIQRITDIIGTNPYAGPIEPLLLNKRRTYRSIVLTRQNKIIYYINKSTIRIAALWDTRREPKKLIEDFD